MQYKTPTHCELGFCLLENEQIISASLTIDIYTYNCIIYLVHAPFQPCFFRHSYLQPNKAVDSCDEKSFGLSQSAMKHIP